MGVEEVKDMDIVHKSSQHIARDTFESAYSWDIKGVGKTEIVGVGNSGEYI